MVGTPKLSIYEYYIRGQKTVAGEKTRDGRPCLSLLLVGFQPTPCRELCARVPEPEAAKPAVLWMWSTARRIC